MSSRHATSRDHLPVRVHNREAPSVHGLNRLNELLPSDPPGPSLKKLSKAEARAKYNHYAGNHPTIHANRMATWEELSKAEKRKWREPLYLPEVPK